MVISSEIGIRSPIGEKIYRLRRTIRIAMLRLPSARVSDHWKGKAARRYAVVVLASSLATLFLIGIALTPFFAILWLVSGSLDSVVALVARHELTIPFTAVAAGYLLLRALGRARG